MKLSKSRAAESAIYLSAAFLIAGCGGNGSPPAPPQLITSDKFPNITCEETKVPMRDSTKLTTYIYKPAGDAAKLPVVMMRTPYGRSLQEGCFGGLGAFRLGLVPAGYALVVQVSRGTFTSEGSPALLTQEADDGYDAVEWAGTQPWSTGKVGMTFGSYLGLTQWQPAIKNPPHLAAIAPALTGSDYHDNWSYVNGVFSPWLNISWLSTVFEPDQIMRVGQAAGKRPADIEGEVSTWMASLASMLDWAKVLPLTSVPQFKAHQPYFYDWLAHPDYDDYWKKMDVEANYHNVKVPALITGASYDLFNVGAARNYQGMRAAGGTEAARTGTKIVWSAYGHASDAKAPTFGSDVRSDEIALERRFFDYYLKGIDNGYLSEPNARIYVMVPPDSGDTGSGFWVSGDNFPLPGTQSVKYYITSSGSANTRAGNGALTTNAAQLGGADRDTFIYDPANPVPTVGGNTCCDFGMFVPDGAREQASVEARQDVLVYTSEPLTGDMPVIGMVKASFWAMTSARDTDFTVKLVDVRPDGQTHNIVDRIVRARYRAGSKVAPSLIQPNTPYQYQLELGNTAMVIPKGHRIRIQVSSSNFPLYARNLNTGADNNSTSEFVVANQTLLHGASTPSFIELPVAPVSRPQ